MYSIHALTHSTSYLSLTPFISVTSCRPPHPSKLLVKVCGVARDLKFGTSEDVHNNVYDQMFYNLGSLCTNTSLEALLLGCIHTVLATGHGL
jgi:hypothetical protein